MMQNGVQDPVYKTVCGSEEAPICGSGVSLNLAVNRASGIYLLPPTFGVAVFLGSRTAWMFGRTPPCAMNCVKETVDGHCSEEGQGGEEGKEASKCCQEAKAQQDCSGQIASEEDKGGSSKEESGEEGKDCRHG